MNDETFFQRAIDEARRCYVEDEIDIDGFERIVEDAFERRDELNGPGGEWREFADEHDLNWMALFPPFEGHTTYV